MNLSLDPMDGSCVTKYFLLLEEMDEQQVPRPTEHLITYYSLRETLCNLPAFS